MAYTTINKSTDYFNTKLYTGNGGTNPITGVGFQPDLVWSKARNNAYSNTLYDVVRGVTKRLYTNSANGENTEANSLTAFGSDGFTLGSDGGSNVNNGTFASWNWKANGTGSANTAGSISSTVSVNTTSGFSIVKYTGNGGTASVGHGLGSAPKMIIAKQYSGAGSQHWTVFHNSLDTNKNLYLNLTNAEDTPSPEIYRKGSFTNDVFAIGAHDRINNNTVSYIAYCFADVPGYQKCGIYTGNGNADGIFCFTGFKPKFVLIKQAIGNNSTNWSITDNKRLEHNPGEKILYPNTSAVEDSYDPIEHLSNGFKLISSTAGYNDSGDTYIYYAVGQPIISNSGVVATAR